MISYDKSEHIAFSIYYEIMTFFIFLSFIFFIATLILSFIFSFYILPFLKQYAINKKHKDKKTLYGTTAEEFKKLHSGDEIKTPRMGGLIIVVPTIFTLISFIVFYYTYIDQYIAQYYLIPPAIFVLLGGLVLGVVCDIADIRGFHISRVLRLFISAGVGAGVGFYLWRTTESITIQMLPYTPVFDIGWGIIVFSALWFLCWYACTVIDGIDALSATNFLIVSLGFCIVFLLSNQPLFTVFFALAGGIAAFLWYNIKPACVYMSETGMIPILWIFAFAGLVVSSTEGVIAPWFLTLAGIVFVATVFSNILQLFWRKVKCEKLFILAPLHHHFEAKGIPPQSVVARYVLVTICTTVTAVLLLLII